MGDPWQCFGVVSQTWLRFLHRPCSVLLGISGPGPSARCSCVGGCGAELAELVSLPVASCRVWVKHHALPWHSSGWSGQNPWRIWK